jgi:valyl-tRNA synthetase
MSTRFNFKEIDEKWCHYWQENQCFHGKADPQKPPYSIVIPPPNVTGILHMGHALNNTLQDIIIRYKRMKGFEALWMPGTDHAGIATQNVVEKQLAKENKTRHEVGREAVLERLWAWKREYGDTIIRQLKKLGSSCDWDRTRFTMDDQYSEAVKHVFISLYEKGLIYKGEYIINWCPRCLTALSDEEAEHQETQGNLWHIRYPFKEDPDRFVVVATTRPETMLGDTAVAVNPEDPRYQDLIGKRLVLPLVDREIPVIADEFVDPEFGTGAVKVTPAHDPNDFAMGKRHDLEFINIMHPNGILNAKAGADFQDTDRFEAREAIVDTLKEQKLLVKVEPHVHGVGHCYRCHTVVEPYLSKQWFVKMKPLAEPAIAAVKDGRIKFHPQRWTKVYMNWMENIRDWCISRQIWWGHRIPVWYCDTCPEGKNVIVAAEAPKTCPHCGSENLTQDEDVLDTWFSSWLWPFATFRWPDGGEGRDPDLEYFYPTSALFTAPEIIFFWVARMIMAGFEFMGDIPFKDVFLHGTVRDTQGRKMSKSLGNAIDPLEIISEYGADALRFSLIMNSGQDLFISKEKFTIGRNFANKIWNASRLILMNCSEADPDFDLAKVTEQDRKDWDLATCWIVSRFYAVLEEVSQAIETFRYSAAETLIYEFFWNDFCDWYLEIAKNKFSDEKIQNILLGLLTNALKMMHPFIPFVTEEIWEIIHQEKGALCRQPWPAPAAEARDPEAETAMRVVIDVTTALRNFRAQWNINKTDAINGFFVSDDVSQRALLEANQEILKRLAGLDKITITHQAPAAKNSAAAVIGNIKCIVPLGDLIDMDQEKKRLTKQMETDQKAFESLKKRLNNQAFVQKAPPEVVAKEKERFAAMRTKIDNLKKVLSELG